jgi:predicted alpha/beta hydrolase family esterase
MQRDWERPVSAEWIRSFERAVKKSGPRTVLAAHSLGCLLVAQWAAGTSLAIKGALLVAVPDPESDVFPEESEGFVLVPGDKFRFSSIVVASTDDAFGRVGYARHCAHSWGSRFVDIGAAGHINAASGLGDWPFGYSLLKELIDA